MYVALAAARRSGMGPSPLALVDVDAYCRLTGVSLTPWELETLFLMDQTALAVANKPKATIE